jgi:hypothetical protein
MSHSQPDIDSLLKEERVFNPPAPFSSRAHIKSLGEYRRIYQRSVEDPEGFWAEIAGELDWFKPWERVLEWEEPFAKWFVGGRLNISSNCLDRHLSTWRKNKAAIIWEGEPGEVRTLTYGQRPRRHLHADDPGAARGDARLRSRRRHAFGDLRRVFGRGAQGPHPGRAGEGRHHGRRRLQARRGGQAQAGRG